MITYKVGICDDEADEVKKIEDLLHEYEATHNIHFEIHSYTDGLKLLRDYQKPHMLHALFLDVEMPLFNGIDLAEHLRGLPDRDLHIIFVSAYPQYMKDSFSVQAFQYISKPFKKEEFMQEVSRFIEDYQQSQSIQVVLPDEEKKHLIHTDDIYYIKCLDARRYLTRFVGKESELRATGRMSDWENQLKDYGFFRCCRSHIINIKHLHYIRKSELVMGNHDIIPLSRRKENDLRKLFNEQLLIIRNLR